MVPRRWKINLRQRLCALVPLARSQAGSGRAGVISAGTKRSVTILYCLLAICALSGSLLGCGTLTPHSRTVEEITVELKPGDYDRIAYVHGEDCVGRYAVFVRLFSPDVTLAARDAMQKAPQANFFANKHVSLEERFIVPLLYHEVCVVVEGRAIELHTLEETKP